MMTLEEFKEEYDQNIVERMVEAFEGVPLPHLSYVKMENKALREWNSAAWSSFKTMAQWKDGETFPLDEAALRWNQTITMLFWGLGFEASRKHYEYGDVAQILEWAATLGDSAATAVGVTAAAMLNNAFATTTISDGVYLISASHPTAGSTQSNLVGAAALSPTTVDSMIVSAMQRVDYRGKPRPERIDKLIVGPTLRKTAREIVGSPQAPYTTDNEINVDAGLGVVIEHNLTSTTAFFGQGPNHKLKGYVGKPMTPHNYDINSTKSRVYGLEGDFVFCAEDWYGMTGCAGA